MVSIPIAAYGKGNSLILCLIVDFTLMGFFVAIGWLPFWFMLIICLIVAALWSNKIKEWVS